MEPSRSGLNFGHHITNRRYKLLVENFENIIGYAGTFEEAVVDAVIDEKCCERRLTFKEWGAWHYEEESSDDSVDPHLNGGPRNAAELEQEEMPCETATGEPPFHACQQPNQRGWI